MPDTDPRTLWPGLTDWTSTGWKEGVLRARDATGDVVYVRPNDGSAPLLRALSKRSEIPVPTVIDDRDGWLLLAALPGVPMEDASWAERPNAAIAVVVTALQALATADVTHGDLCLPNILGDPETGQLTGIVYGNVREQVRTRGRPRSRDVELGVGSPEAAPGRRDRDPQGDQLVEVRRRRGGSPHRVLASERLLERSGSHGAVGGHPR